MNMIEKAKEFAYEMHKGQTRKGKEIPFTYHLEEVVGNVSKLTSNPNVIAAAWLHDVVEDTEATHEDIEELFNEEIARLVRIESEDKMTHMSAQDSWTSRKVSQLKLMGELKFNDDVYMIALSDKLANVSEMCHDIRNNRENYWSKFNNADPEAHEWYHKSFADIIDLNSELGSSEVFDEYVKCIYKLFI